MHNMLTTLPEGMFTSLVVIITIMNGNLILSYNRLSVLPMRIFASLKVAKDGTLDITNNDLVTLPGGVFI